MKIIDLLNKIAKGEEVPKNIIIRNNIYMLKDDRDLYNINFTYEDMYENYWLDNAELNEKIEIIEEEKEIEKINYYPIRKNEIAVDYIENNERKHFCLNKKEKYFVDKINELVREVNKLKNK